MKRITGIAILSVLMACNPSEQKTSQLKDSTQTDTLAQHAPVIKDQKRAGVFTAYENLKNDLVKSDSAAAQKSAASLQSHLADLEGCELTAKIAAKIAENNSLVHQRKEFTTLSADVIALFKSTEIEQGTLYIQHCPMANKGDGGDWLSSAKEIRNPYYGNEMLECGRVTEEIKSK